MELVGRKKVKIKLGCMKKHEVRDLKSGLVVELEKVRSLVKKIQKAETLLDHETRDSHDHRGNNKTFVDASLKRVDSEVGSVGAADSLLPLNNASKVALKEKKSVRGNQVNKNSDTAPPKGKSGKFPAAVDNNKKVKSSGDTTGFASSSQLFKTCSALLGRLMKHEYSWVFNEPVDAKNLGLRDYFTIVKTPMDLGTVKSRLSKNWYKSAKEFAEDVRLTFNNAMLYNPKGHDVHHMADQLLKMFDVKWKETEAKFILNRSAELGKHVNFPGPTSRVSGNPVSVPKKTPVPKKPESKDRDMEKKDMSYDEKERLSMSLQTLPPDKLDTVVQIIKKRMPGLFQEEDDIELDLEIVDHETLLELDSFVTNYKKSLNKNKRKAEVALPEVVETDRNTNQENFMPAAAVGRTVTEAAEEPSPVRVEQPSANISRSNNSGSSSSDSRPSSSGSDSGSSSGSGSDAGH
ncbi:hypothetical protein ACFE04_022880 [Oxalis oulophora]